MFFDITMRFKGTGDKIASVTRAARRAPHRRNERVGCEKPPEKPAAGRIACPAILARWGRLGRFGRLGSHRGVVGWAAFAAGLRPAAVAAVGRRLFWRRLAWRRAR